MVKIAAFTIDASVAVGVVRVVESVRDRNEVRRMRLCGGILMLFGY